MQVPLNLKQSVVKRLQMFPVMNRSMFTVTLTSYPTKEIMDAIDELVKEGVIKEDKYQSHRRQTSVYFLASQEASLTQYLLEGKK